MHNKQVKYETNPENKVIGNIKSHPVFKANNGRTNITPPIIPFVRPITVIKLLIAIRYKIKGKQYVFIF
jgi:hypothetical protein